MIMPIKYANLKIVIGVNPYKNCWNKQGNQFVASLTTVTSRCMYLNKISAEINIFISMSLVVVVTKNHVAIEMKHRPIVLWLKG